MTKFGSFKYYKIQNIEKFNFLKNRLRQYSGNTRFLYNILPYLYLLICSPQPYYCFRQTSATLDMITF